MTKIHYGFNPELELKSHTDKDWVYGGASDNLKGIQLGSTIEDISENQELIKYLPTGEVQQGNGDMMDCATRGPTNIVETKLNYWLKSQNMSVDNAEWLNDNGYINDRGSLALSDAFIAILSKTSPQGNSLKAPLEAIKDYGCVPKKVLPLETWMTQAQYLNKKRITKEMMALGEEFKKRFPLNFIRYGKDDFNNIDDYDLLDIALYAWPTPKNGIYPRVWNNLANHCVMKINKVINHLIFDNYEDPYVEGLVSDNVDWRFIKRLAPDYDLYDYGYRVIINEQIFTFELHIDMVRFIYLLREDVRGEFPASNGFYSINDPSKHYSIYDWCRRYGVKENPEVFIYRILEQSRITANEQEKKDAALIPSEKTAKKNFISKIIKWLISFFGL